MAVPAHSRRHTKIVTVIVLIAVALIGVPPTARAATTTVACDGTGDIADVQSAIDAASSGDVIRLSGTCDFTGALAHGGTTTSIEATAVLIRPGVPVTDLVIESAGSAQSATIVGSGTETAFTIAPGNERVTIRGLRFVNLARPVVVVGAANATIGAAGSTPAASGNRIVGDGFMDSAILAVADSAPMSVKFGVGGAASGSPAVLAGGTLAGLRILGNAITYSPPGAADPTGNRDVVAIDVRQANGGIVDGVTISQNAVGMFASHLASFRHNAVRVQGTVAVPASDPPQSSDARIRNVTVTDNNLGWLERLEGTDVSGVDTERIHAAGRVGVLLVRVADFDVSANRIRARVSTGTTSPPGGGIVVSDSGFGAVQGNEVLSLSDPDLPATRDLGAIAVVEGVPRFFGDFGTDQATTSVRVSANTIGEGSRGSSKVRRGLVLSGADFVTAWNNEITSPDGPAISVGADLRSTDGSALVRRVTRGVVCDNRLDGMLDGAPEVAFLAPASGNPSSTGNAFPTGSSHGNAECNPTVAATPQQANAGQGVTVAGQAWAARPFFVNVVGDDNTVLTKAAASGDDGIYQVEFTSAELSPLPDGALTIASATQDPVGIQRVSPLITIAKNYVIDPPNAGTASINDGDGWSNLEEIFVGVPISWTAPSSGVSGVDYWFTDSGGVKPPACGIFTGPPAGQAAVPPSCGSALPQGLYRLHMRWRARDGEVSPVVSNATSVKDTIAPSVQIGAPAQDQVVVTNAVDVTGSASEPGVTVTIQTGAWPTKVLGTATADGVGAWAKTLTLANGEHQISAFARDPAGNRGGSSPVRSFVVDPSQAPPPPPPPPPPGSEDTTPPDPPVVLAPAPNSVQPGTFTVSGTAEPESTVRVIFDGAFKGEVRANPSGGWSLGVSAWSGPHNVKAQAYDAAGNESALSAVVAFHVDSVGPSLTITTPEDAFFLVGTPAVIEGTASDASQVARVVVEYYRSGGSGGVEQVDVACTPQADADQCPGAAVSWQSSPGTTLLPGVYFARAIAYDAVGNTTDRTIRFFKVQ